MENKLKEIRLKNNGITNLFNSAYDCISALHGIQAQYDIYAYISLVNRVKKFDLDELHNCSSIVKSWGQRVTLHLNTKDNMIINKAIYTSQNNWIKKYISQLDGKCDEIISQIVNANYENEFFSKTEVQRNILHKKKKDMMQWGGVLAQASIEGYIYEMVDGEKEKRYTKLETDMLKKIIDYDMALGNLIEKYIISYGPVSSKDFAHWSGLRKCDFIEIWEKTVGKFDQLRIGENIFFYKKQDIEKKEEEVVLLGKFDPLLLSYDDKNWLVEEKYRKNVWKNAGQDPG